MPAIISRAEARTLGLTRYFTSRPCKRGHVAERYVSNLTCSACDLIKSKTWNGAHPQYVQSWRAQLSADPFSPENSLRIARYICRRARGHAKERGIEFSLTLQDLLPLPTHCPVLGYELVYLVSRDDQGHVLPHSASLDRIDSTKGYIPGNVQIISWRANRIKADATVEELKSVLTHCEMHEAFPF